MRRVIDRLGVAIEQRDIWQNPAYRAELVAGGERSTVPCLRVAHDDGRAELIYESWDIVNYLERHFGE